MQQQELKRTASKLPASGYNALCRFISSNGRVSDVEVLNYAKKNNIVCGNGANIKQTHVDQTRKLIATGKRPYQSSGTSAVPVETKETRIDNVAAGSVVQAAPVTAHSFTQAEKLFLITLVATNASSTTAGIDILTLQRKILG